MNAYRLYLVTDDQQDLATLKRVVKKAVEGGVTMVQVREKHGDVRAFIERAQAVKNILKDTDVPLIINDRVDVALAVDADGVHLGQSDMPAIIARELIGPNKILGLSIENEEQLAEADSLPIDYIVTKEQTVQLNNGHEMMPYVTGMGCTLTALTGAFAAVGDNTGLAAAAVLGVVGEIAAEQARGPGSLQINLLDELYQLDEETLAKRLKLHVQ